MELWNLTLRQRLASHVVLADRWWRRLRGLMGRRHWPADHAMVITPCTSIHTWFVRFPIDVIYLDAQGSVLRVVEDLRPWRMSFGPRRTACVVELCGGTLATCPVHPGDVLRVCASSADLSAG